MTGGALLPCCYQDDPSSTIPISPEGGQEEKEGLQLRKCVILVLHLKAVAILRNWPAIPDEPISAETANGAALLLTIFFFFLFCPASFVGHDCSSPPLFDVSEILTQEETAAPEPA